MKIGNITIQNPVALAPMAGVTDKAFRILVKKYGCGIIYTEMVSAKALTYKNKKTFELIDLKDEEAPISVQIFGSEPEIMAEGALIVEEYGADIIDINMGCPVPKIIKNNEGSSLMLNPDLAANIVEKISKKVKIPVTVKIRKGWDENNLNAVEFAKKMEASGAAAIAIHGRTRDQFYSGNADWNTIKQVKEVVNIPVIGNGDIILPQDAKNMFEQTDVDAVMVGRGVFGRPWILGSIGDFLANGTEYKEPSIIKKVNIAREHAHLAIKYKPEQLAMKEMRKHLGWYFKGLPGATAIRRNMNSILTLEDFESLLSEYLEVLNKKSC
ncbi:tRNA-U20-dihydrouridine synthase [Desulfonispora thiosulfatigenes DSM 11270]|uniref:tRNA-dihydrouridine synthase n=1 Tax=Desulfonispora thiosulfatigenes DSM 11270 TaxID=656914 RepID=A0A1W1UXD4_DESTI|nr:tRNA dihydrouridine synthase DusB [Desulfonispora thiosulfatigenes]SMB85763.1 tRNA-U20-dihydrouridine synthase [Desulfonispora thiosulfatigenes DSM 11270]